MLCGPAKTIGDNIDEKTVLVTGMVIDKKGRPEIEVYDTAKITLN